MKILSATYPSSKVIGENNGTVYVTSDLINTDGCDPMTPSFDATLWAETTQDITTGTNPYQVTFNDGSGLGGESYAQLKNDAVFIPSALTAGTRSFSFRIKYIVDEEPLTPITVMKFTLAGTTSGTTDIEITYDNGSYNFTDAYGAELLSGDLSDVLFRVILHDNRYQLVANYEDGSVAVLLSGTLAVFVGQVDVILRMENTTAQLAGTVELHSFRNEPALASPFCRNATGLPILQSFTEGFASFRIDPGTPGTKTVTLYGCGSQLNSEEEVDSIEVVETKLGEDSLKLLVSPVESFLLQGANPSICPDTGVASLENVGDMSLQNDCCFCDGSSKTEDELKVEVINQAYADVYRNRRDRYPKVLATDTSGTKWGSNFDFNRVHYFDDDISGSGQDILSNERVFNLRQLELSDSKLAYYGLLGVETTSETVIAKLTYTFSAYQIANAGLVVDQFYWKMCNEDGTVVEEASGITYANYTDPGKVPTAQALNNGRYYFLVGCSTNSTYSEITNANGQRIDVSIRQGSLTSDPILAQGFTQKLNWVSLGWTHIEPADETNTRFDGFTYVNFEIEPRVAKPFVYIYDVCASTLDMYIHTSVDADTTYGASTRTMSVAAFENDDGDVVLAYQYTQNLNHYESRSREISFVTLDVSLGTFSDRQVIELPRSLFWGSTAAETFGPEYLLNFDLVRDDDDNLLVMFARENTDTIARNAETSPPFTPYGTEGFDVIEWDISRISFDGASSYLIDETNFKTVNIESLPNALKNTTPNSFREGRANGNYVHTTPATIRANRNSDTGLIVVSALEMNTRWPTIWMGDNDFMKEVSVPHHFTMREDLDNVMRGTVDIRGRYNCEIDSLDACLATDGMIYSVASKDHKYELGLNDPELFWDDRQSFYLPTIDDTTNSSNFDIFRPEFRFEALPFYSPDNAATRKKSVLSINSLHQYLTVAIGDRSFARSPIILKNGSWDELPMETFKGVAWFPEMQDDSSMITETDVTYSQSAPAQLAATTGELTLTIPTTTSYHALSKGLEDGMRWHARVDGTASGLTMSTKSTTWDIPVVEYAPSYDLPLDTVYVLASATINAGVISFNYGSGPTSAGSVAVPAGIYDIYIMVERIAYRKARICFVVKEARIGSSLTHEYDMKNELIHWSSEELVSLSVSSSEEDTYMSLTDAGTVYEMGVNTLKADTGLKAFVSGTVNAISRQFPYPLHFDSSRGRYRTFDDTTVFEYKGEPQLPLVSGFMDDVQESGSFHWYDGFVMRLRGLRAIQGDNWAVQRQSMDGPDLIASKNVAGKWNSFDSGTYTVYARASDSGLEKFRADTFVVTGANIKDIEIVGRNSDSGIWTHIGNLNLEVFKTDDAAYADIGSRMNVKMGETDISIGRFSEHQFYAKPSDIFEYPSKIAGNAADLLYCDIIEGETYSDTTMSIYSSRGVLRLDEYVEYQEIGFRLTSALTYEGHMTLSAADFGIARDIPLLYNHSDGSGMTYDMKTEMGYVISQSAIPLEDTDKILKKFSFSYKITDGVTYLKLAAISDAITLNRRPLWVIPEHDVDPNWLQLCLIESFTSKVLIDEDGDKYYEMQLTLKGVSE